MQRTEPIWSLNDLLRHRHCTGEFGNCHVRMSERTFAATRYASPVTSSRKLVFAELLGLPVVVDAEVPDGSWHLAENAEPHHVVRTGRVGG